MPRLIALLLLVLPALSASASLELAAPHRSSLVFSARPVIAANADGFLALWGQGQRADVVGAAIDPDGRRRDPRPIGVATFDEHGYGTLVPLGSGFLLQAATGRTPLGQTFEYFRVSSSGKIEGSWSPAFPFDHFGIVAATVGGDRVLFQKPGLEAVILDERGNLVRSLVMPFERDTPWHTVTATDSEFILTWWDTHALNVERVPADGSPSRRIQVATAERFNGMIPFASAAVASDGGDILIYTQRQLDPATALKSIRVTADGAVVPNPEFRAPVSWTNVQPETVAYVPMALHRAADHYVLLRSRAGRVEALRLDEKGLPLDPEPQAVMQNVQEWSVARRGNRFYVVGLNMPPLLWGVSGASFRSDGRVSDVRQEALSAAHADQVTPRVASDGTSFFAAWHEWGASSGQLRGVVFDLSGRRSEIIEQAGWTTGSSTPPTGHDVAWGAGVYVLAWTTQRSVFAVRIAPGGTVLDRAPIEIGAVVSDRTLTDIPVRVVSNGSLFLIVWSTERQLYAATLSPSGATSPVRSLRGGPAPRQYEVTFRSFDLASDGQRFLAVWSILEQIGSDWIYTGPSYSESMEIDASGVPASNVATLLREESHGALAGSLVWNGREFINVHRARRDQIALQPLDRNGRPSGTAATIAIPESAVVGRVHFANGEIWVPYQTAIDDRPIKGVLRVNGGTRYQFGSRGETFAWSDMVMATNAAGQTIIAVHERRPDEYGVYSQRAVVYTEDDFRPLFGRRRSVQR